MTKAKALTQIAAGVAMALCITSFLELTAQSNPKDESKSKKQQKRVHLISSVQGVDLFQAYCANCHGPQGRGNGDIASAAVLDTKVPDLTTLAKRNGGTFPAQRVRSIIAGDELIKAHGSREMPLWGAIFRKGEKHHDRASVRLENITRYIESIQGK